MPLTILPGKINPDGRVYLPGRFLPVSGGIIDAANVQISVSAGSDDAYEDPGSGPNNTNNGILMTANGAHTGLRFTNVPIHQGAIIYSANIELYLTESAKNDAEGTWYAHAIDSAPTFTAADGDVDGRTKTVASASWTNNDIGVNTDVVRTPDLTSLVQEVISRPGWVKGNDIVLLYVHASDTEELQFATFETPGPAVPAKLNIEYSALLDGGTSMPPVRHNRYHRVLIG